MGYSQSHNAARRIRGKVSGKKAVLKVGLEYLAISPVIFRHMRYLGCVTCSDWTLSSDWACLLTVHIHIHMHLIKRG
jgi:hypothetical protein